VAVVPNTQIAEVAGTAVAAAVAAV